LTPERDLHLETLKRTFTLQAHDALSTVLAPVLVRRVADVAPGVHLRFLGEPADETTDLRRGLIDLAIGSGFQQSPEMEHDSVGTNELVGLARLGHPILEHMIAEPGMALPVWVSVPHVVVSRRGRLRDSIDDQLDESGHPRRVVASTASTGAALEIVGSTDAVVTVPASVAWRLETNFTAFTLPIDIPAVPIVLAWHRQFSADKGHHWLRRLVREELTQSSVGNGTSRV
jgi:DNA-binding transcriptional LysR family regulator